VNIELQLSIEVITGMYLLPVAVEIVKSDSSRCKMVQTDSGNSGAGMNPAPLFI
jgi:hypothetical protein